MPHCFLRPESRIVDLPGSLSGGQDIDFLKAPAFSAASTLQGDEHKLRLLFDAELRAWFSERIRVDLRFEALEDAEDALVVYCGRQISPEQALELMDESLRLAKLLAKKS